MVHPSTAARTARPPRTNAPHAHGRPAPAQAGSTYASLTANRDLPQQTRANLCAGSIIVRAPWETTTKSTPKASRVHEHVRKWVRSLLCLDRSIDRSIRLCSVVCQETKILVWVSFRSSIHSTRSTYKHGDDGDDSTEKTSRKMERSFATTSRRSTSRRDRRRGFSASRRVARRGRRARRAGRWRGS